MCNRLNLSRRTKVLQGFILTHLPLGLRTPLFSKHEIKMVRLARDNWALPLSTETCLFNINLHKNFINKSQRRHQEKYLNNQHIVPAHRLKMGHFVTNSIKICYERQILTMRIYKPQQR